MTPPDWSRFLTHCTIDQLTDHLLGLADERTSERVEAHLASGCARCGALLAALSRIRRVGRLDAEQQLDSRAVRTVKSLSGFAPPRHRPRRVQMRLAFDSAQSPALAGTRSLRPSSRRLVFTSREYALDLHMDYERSVHDVVVVGQLMNRDGGPLCDITTALVCAGREVSRSTTGRFGEFHMEGRPSAPMHLQLLVDEEEMIEVEIDRQRGARG